MLLKNTDWQFASVSSDRGTWSEIDAEFVNIGDCKYTPKDIEIAPAQLSSIPEHLIVWLHCTNPPVFLPKGQIIAQLIPTFYPPTGENDKTINAAVVIGENKPEEECQLTMGGETASIKAVLDTGADITIIPEKNWPSNWPLQSVGGQVQDIGGFQLAKQSKNVVQIQGPKGQLANLHPFVLKYKEPLLGRDLMAQWGVTMNIPDPSKNFQVAVAEQRPHQKLTWKTDKPVWVEQWPLTKQKLEVLNNLVKEQLEKGHIEETNSPWNSPVFVIQKSDKTRWRLLQDLCQINNVIEEMGSLQPGMPSPTMLPRNWDLAVIDIKDCFFQIPLHPDDAQRFAFSVPTLNWEASRKRYHWKVLPQGMLNSPVICQWYVSSLLSSVREAAEKAIIFHNTDDVLVCTPNEDLLTYALDLTVDALVAAGFELQKSKIQKMPPWKYLGLEIGKRTIKPQNWQLKQKLKLLQMSINCVEP
ncbi:hypothetical protein HGM15179_021250 [Zosterops borbonicus]|uniref:ribonuclease H n=1 Tax=Zosterops borbonicus TaxID=364589 RepID=A0A8K1FWF6_9PASS|nr:hypothetical protein HGM15179_021250 [Zosterops borbonicus]